MAPIQSSPQKLKNSQKISFNSVAASKHIFFLSYSLTNEQFMNILVTSKSYSLLFQLLRIISIICLEWVKKTEHQSTWLLATVRLLFLWEENHSQQGPQEKQEYFNANTPHILVSISTIHALKPNLWENNLKPDFLSPCISVMPHQLKNRVGTPYSLLY